MNWYLSVTSHRLKLKCRCSATCHASSMTRGALQGLLEMVASSGVPWQTGPDSICIVGGVLTRGCLKKRRSVLSTPLPHGTYQMERAYMLILYLNVFGFCKSKLDIFSNRSSNYNNPLPVISVDLLKNKSLVSTSLSVHFTTSNSLNKSIPKHMPPNLLWPLLKEYIGLSSSKVVRQGESLGSCFPRKPFAGSSQSSSSLKSLAGFGETQLRSRGKNQGEWQISGEYQYQGAHLLI